uniref:ABC transporter ATP-binding protein n=2 Tax=Geoglobus ahangari TaxID=113653 RepID=A0A7C3YDG0_9EURY
MELKADRVDVKISGRKIIESVSFTLKKGELVALLGPNGSGKSTLLKTIFGILKPHHGVVYIDRKTINDFERRDIAKLLGYLSQEITSANLKVLDIVLLGRVPHAGVMPTKRDVEVSLKALKLVGMDGYEERLFSELSGGEKQKVMLARIFSQEVEFLLLD